MQKQIDEVIRLSIEGMACTGCAKAVTQALSQVAGVTAVAVDFDARQARIEGEVSPDSLIAAVKQAGFGARPAGN